MNYKCLDDNNCHVLYSDSIDSTSLVILKSDEFIVSQFEIEQVSNDLTSLILILLLTSFLLGYLFSKFFSYFSTLFSTKSVKD